MASYKINQNLLIGNTGKTLYDLTNNINSLEERKILKKNIGYSSSTLPWVRFMRVNCIRSWRSMSFCGYMNGQTNSLSVATFYIKVYSNTLPSMNIKGYVGIAKGEVSASDFKGIIVESSSSKVVIDFYVKINRHYAPFMVVLTDYSDDYGDELDFSISENQVTSLPSGTQISFS